MKVIFEHLNKNMKLKTKSKLKKMSMIIVFEKRHIGCLII